MLGLLLLAAIGLMAGGLANHFSQDGGGMGRLGAPIAGLGGSLFGGLLTQAFGVSATGWSEDSVLLVSFGVALVGAIIAIVIVGLIRR